MRARPEGAGLGFHAVELEMAELGVGHEFAVDEQGAADAGAEAQHQHGAAHIARGAEVHFGEAGGVGVVDGDDFALELGGGGLGERLADPGLGDVGGGVDRSADDDAGKGDAGRRGCAVSSGTAAAMACSISLTADMAGEGTEWRSPTRHPWLRSTTAALIDEPSISIPIACRCIPR